MRKTLLLISAVFAMLAAVSCNKEELNNVDVPQTSVESLEFIAYTDVATKTTLNGVKTEWESGDEIAINGVCYFTEDEGTMAKFIKDPSEEGNPGVPFYAVYPYYAKMDEGEYVIDFLSSGNTTLTAGSIGDDVISIAYSESEHELNFKNVVSLIKFQVPAEGISEIRISANEYLAGEITVDYNGGEEPKVTHVSKGQKELVLTASEGTFAVRTDYYVPVLPGAKTNLTVTIDETVVAEGKPIEFKRSKIHYLGTLPSVPEPDPVTIYLKPGVWDVADAWFAAYFFNSNDGYADVAMKDSDSDGIYEVIVPAGMESVIFCRMNPEYPEFGWNIKDGEDIVEHHVWNQSGDLSLPLSGDDKVCYSVSGWNDGSWKTLEEATSGPTPELDSEWALAGTFNGWGNEIFKTTSTENLFVIKNLALDAYDEIKVKTAQSWDTSYGGGIKNLQQNKWMTVYSGGANIPVTTAGTYDVYFDFSNTKLYLMIAGTSYDTAAEQNVDGPESSTPANWYLVGSFNGWDPGDANYQMSDNGTYYVFKNFTAPANCEMKFAPGKWSGDKGGNNENFSTGNWFSTGGSNIKVTQGTYDVYLNKNLTQYKFVEPGQNPE